MSEKLSKEEVDALLEGVAKGDVEGPSVAETAPEAEPIDLLAPKNKTPEKLRVLEVVQSEFLKHVKKSLARVFGRTPQVTCQHIEAVKLSDFVKGLAVPLNVHVFDLSPLPGEGLFSVSPRLAFTLVDFLLGGMGSEVKTDGREYSPTENRLLRRLVGELLSDVEKAWAGVVKIECRYRGLELSAAGLGRLEEDSLAVLPLEIRLAEAPLQAHLCFPVSAAEAAGKRISQVARGGGRKSLDWGGTIGVSLLDAEVAVSAELGTVTMSVRKLLGLKVGDTITLGTTRSQPITVRVEGVEKFVGVPGVLNGSNAVRIGDAAE